MARDAGPSGDAGSASNWLESFDPDLRDDPETRPVALPGLWAIAERYMLRGNNQYQRAGLEILASFTANFPLDDATATLEQFFRQHAYAPSDGMRGGLSISAVHAAYAVATTPDYVGAYEVGAAAKSQDERHDRVVVILQKCLATVRRLNTSDGPDSDAQLVLDTIAAIRSGNPAATRASPAVGHGALRREEDRVDSAEEANSQPQLRDRGAIAGVVREVLEQELGRLSPASLSPMDVVTSKYEIALVRKDLETFATRLDAVDKAIDRSIGKSQVNWTAVGVGVAILVGIAALALTWMQWFVAAPVR
jgi:hypothetical protein